VKDNPVFVAAMLSLAIRACQAAPALKAAMKAYGRADYTEAASRLLAAAINGLPEAQQLLGFMYAIGGDFYPGIKRNMEVAGLWLERAARAQSPAARYMIEALARRGPAAVYADVKYCFDRIESMDDPLRQLMVSPVRC